MSKSTKPYKLVRNSDTGETYRATPSSEWTEKLAEWRAAMTGCKSAAECPIPSPMPLGHIMFLRSPKRRPAVYKPVDAQ